jgi:hypothetical protein
MSHKITIPEAQRQELITALITLLTVILSIGLTLATQAISSVIAPPLPIAGTFSETGAFGEAGPFREAGSSSEAVAIQSLGTSHFSKIETGTLTLNTHTFTGPVIAVSGTVSNTGTLAHTLTVTPTYAVCTAQGANAAIVTVTSKAATTLTLGLLTHAGAAANAIPVTCMVVP